MDVERFSRELPGLFADFPHSEQPRDPRFEQVLAAVPGLARANNLALLNLAAGCLQAGESYLEVGTFRGTSLIAAMLDNADKDFVAVDSFELEGGSKEQLEQNLAAFELEERATIIEGDAAEVLCSDALQQVRAGVYYYDAGHTYEQQLEGLTLAEPYLVDGALIVVDDTDWEHVARAQRDYLARQPKARLLLEIAGKDAGQPQWWEGVQLLVWNG